MWGQTRGILMNLFEGVYIVHSHFAVRGDLFGSLPTIYCITGLGVRTQGRALFGALHLAQKM